MRAALVGAAAAALAAAATLAGSSGAAATVAGASSSGAAATVAGASSSGASTSASWNPNTSCVPVVTTIEAVLGSAMSAQGGATFAGGAFEPGVPNKRAFSSMPCSVTRSDGTTVPTLVEIHDVVVSCYAHATPSDGDYACILVDPSAPSTTTTYMKRIHIETDKKFQAAVGWSVPPNQTPLDVQGFVYWDPNHTTSAQHSYTGWELHSFTAWRPTQGLTPSATVTAINKALTVGPVAIAESDDE